MPTDDLRELLVRLYEIARVQQQTLFEVTVACKATCDVFPASQPDYAALYEKRLEGLRLGVHHSANVVALHLINNAIRRLEQ